MEGILDTADCIFLFTVVDVVNVCLTFHKDEVGLLSSPCSFFPFPAPSHGYQLSSSKQAV